MRSVQYISLIKMDYNERVTMDDSVLIDGNSDYMYLNTTSNNVDNVFFLATFNTFHLLSSL